MPIASLTKLTTAVVVLRDHPVPAGTEGPTIALTSDDAAEYQAEFTSTSRASPSRRARTSVNGRCSRHS